MVAEKNISISYLCKIKKETVLWLKLVSNKIINIKNLIK